MFKKAKRIMAAVLTAGMVLSAAATAMAAGSPTASVTPIEDSTKVVKTVYVKSNTSEATLKSVEKGSKKTLVIPESVKVYGEEVQITKIGANAFRNNKKVTTVKLSAKTKRLNKNAFRLATKLKTITYSGKKSLTVKKGAFNGINTKKVTFKVSKNMSKKERNKLKKALKKAGFQGKVKVAKKL